MAKMNCLKLLAFSLIISYSKESEMLDQLSLIFKDTYVVYGIGRRSERDLPVCESAYEACNLAHHRPWLRPITERLCRCPRRTECPLKYEEGRPSNSQHVSNRAQLKFCEELDASFEPCAEGGPALEILLQNATRTNEGHTRTSLFCKCPWPNTFVLNKTTTIEERAQILLYTCNELPRCKRDEVCGHVRNDTYEMYYTCSCPTKHLCVFKEPFTLSTEDVIRLALLHFRGESYEAVCTPK